MGVDLTSSGVDADAAIDTEDDPLGDDPLVRLFRNRAFQLVATVVVWLGTTIYLVMRNDDLWPLLAYALPTLVISLGLYVDNPISRWASPENPPWWAPWVVPLSFALLFVGRMGLQFGHWHVALPPMFSTVGVIWAMNTRKGERILLNERLQFGNALFLGLLGLLGVAAGLALILDADSESRASAIVLLIVGSLVALAYLAWVMARKLRGKPFLRKQLNLTLTRRGNAFSVVWLASMLAVLPIVVSESDEYPVSATGDPAHLCEIVQTCSANSS